MIVRGLLATLLVLGLVFVLEAPATTEAAVPDVFEDRRVTIDDGGHAVEFRYRLLRPDASAPAGRHPVVLFLHGAGERGDDNESQLKFLPLWMAEPENRKRHPCFLIAPQCRKDSAWAKIDWKLKQPLPLAEHPTVDLAAAVAALDAVLAEESADPARVYLTGLSMGGYGTWDLACRSPDRFAAALPICGGGDQAAAPRLAATSLWCFHGDEDPLVPVALSRSMIEAIVAAGGAPIYSELPGVGHDSWTPAYRNPAVLDWLFSQRRR
ncbi:MAG: prolyl oligopeptidase family serine peptidase [Pirellulales bacterium]